MLKGGSYIQVMTILRISLIDDDDYTLLHQLLNKPVEKEINEEFKISLKEKIKKAKKNISKIHNKIPDAEITNIGSKYQQNRNQFERYIEE